MNGEGIITSTTSHTHSTNIMQQGKAIFTYTTFNIQDRVSSNTITEILFICIFLNRVKFVIFLDALITTRQTFRIIKLSNLERILTSTAINISSLCSTINGNLVITAITIQIYNINTSCKVDTLNIIVSNFARICLLLRQQGNKAQRSFDILTIFLRFFLVHTHEQGIIIFRTFDSKRICIKLIRSRIGNICIVRFAFTHQGYNYLVATALTINKVHTRTRHNLVVATLCIVIFCAYSILIDFFRQTKIFAECNLIIFKRRKITLVLTNTIIAIQAIVTSSAINGIIA